MSIDIMKYIETEIAKLEKEVKDMQEDFPERNIESFYDCGMDGDGCPVQYGNYNDTYDSGYDNGENAGKLEMLYKFKELLTQGPTA